MVLPGCTNLAECKCPVDTGKAPPRAVCIMDNHIVHGGEQPIEKRWPVPLDNVDILNRQCIFATIGRLEHYFRRSEDAAYYLAVCCPKLVPRGESSNYVRDPRWNRAGSITVSSTESC